MQGFEANHPKKLKHPPFGERSQKVGSRPTSCNALKIIFKKNIEKLAWKENTYTFAFNQMVKPSG
jgi:hypothetical protein